MGKLQIRRGAGEVPALLPGEQFLASDGLYIGKEDGTGNLKIELTPAQIKAALESLTNDARLDASAIKNLPAGGGGSLYTTEVASRPTFDLLAGVPLEVMSIALNDPEDDLNIASLSSSSSSLTVSGINRLKVNVIGMMHATSFDVSLYLLTFNLSDSLFIGVDKKVFYVSTEFPANSATNTFDIFPGQLTAPTMPIPPAQVNIEESDGSGTLIIEFKIFIDTANNKLELKLYATSNTDTTANTANFYAQIQQMGASDTFPSQTPKV